jgi:hypothetical protein
VVSPWHASPHSLLSTDVRFFLFPTILVAQVLVGAMDNTPPIYIGVGDISLLFSLDGFCTFTCGDRTGILHLYSRTALLRRFAFCDRVFDILSLRTPDSLSMTKHEMLTFKVSFLILSSSSCRGFQSSRSGEGRVNVWMGFHTMVSPTFISYPPVQTRISTYDFSTAPFSALHSSCRYRSRGSLYTISQFSSFPHCWCLVCFGLFVDSKTIISGHIVEVRTLPYYYLSF